MNRVNSGHYSVCCALCALGNSIKRNNVCSHVTKAWRLFNSGKEDNPVSGFL